MPSYSYEHLTNADTLETPLGPSVQNNDWTTALENTRYYQEFANGYPASSNNGQAGPCVQDDRFGYQLGFSRTNGCQTGGSLPAAVPIIPSNGSGPSTGNGSFPIITNPTQCFSTKGSDFDSECRIQYGRDYGF